MTQAPRGFPGGGGAATPARIVVVPPLSLTSFLSLPANFQEAFRKLEFP
ncbi:hypothetical protein [Actinotignum sanguinis]|nr:hypothetical protein [Actinotignum sanguinis]MDK8748065.1 hypothetical protein [Actinotignum sanguinis]